MRYSITWNVKDFKKYVFQFEKRNFEPNGNFACNTGFLILWKALLIILSLYLQMLIMQISTQTDNHKYRQNVRTKNVHSKKMGLKFWKPNFNILCKIEFIAQ